MRLKLNQQFTTEEKKYINYYLCGISFGNYIYLGAESLTKFLVRLSYHHQKDEMLTKEEKYQLASKLLDNIMEDDESFIGIIMNQSTLLHGISTYPPLRNQVQKVMEKVAHLLSSNKEAREKLIQEIIDLRIITQIGSYYGKIFLRALLKANDMDRLLKSNQQMRDEIKRFPDLAPFFIMSALRNEKLFSQVFQSSDDLEYLKKVLDAKSIKLPKEKEDAIREGLGKIQIEEDNKIQ